jgi:hypothetical protein
MRAVVVVFSKSLYGRVRVVPANPDLDGFLTGLSPQRQAEAARLIAIFAEVTGYAPRLYPGGMVGFGRYAYAYASGHSGTSMATGFAPRKAELSIYLMPGESDISARLAALGKHRMGKGCLYLRRLEDADEAVLRSLIAECLAHLKTQWRVDPT